MIIAFVGLISVLGGVSWAVRRSYVTVAMWITGSVALIAFAYVKFPGAIRHHGFFWVLLVATIWMAVDAEVVSRRLATAVLTPILLVSLAASAIAAWWDWRAPFSGARCAAASILEQGADTLPIVGAVDWAASGVAAYLPHGRLYFPAKRGPGSFIIWNLDRLRQQDLTQYDLVRETIAQDRGDGAILITNDSLSDPEEEACQEVFRCAPAIVGDEGLWGYRCHREDDSRELQSE